MRRSCYLMASVFSVKLKVESPENMDMAEKMEV
jgi:hypothetical protein